MREDIERDQVAECPTEPSTTMTLTGHEPACQSAAGIDGPVAVERDRLGLIVVEDRERPPGIQRVPKLARRH